MKHLILGYGYCGYYLAQELLSQRHRVWTLSRSLKESYFLDSVMHLKGDITKGLSLAEDMNVIHYMIAPIKGGTVDTVLRHWLAENKIKTGKIIYYGSSGVYGDQQGAITTEISECHLEFERQFQYLDAEKQLIAYGLSCQIPITLLRIAGVLGPNRLPTTKIEHGESIIKVSEAPWTNTIYVKDLVKIALMVAKKSRKTSIFNVSDGIPTPMGSTHRLLSILMKIHRVYEKSFEEIFELASPLKRELLMASKKMSIDKLKKCLGDDLVLTDKVNILKESLFEMEQAQNAI